MSAPRSLGDYDLGALIGRGGMSEVYEARDRRSGAVVAIKLLRSHLAGDAKAVEAFAAEAARTRMIEHPNVVAVKDFGHDGGAFYLVMERLDGETLAAALSRGPLDEARARELGAAIADGVAAAHAQGIVHRDLKPGNVVLVAGAPKIVDFGIARYIAGGDAQTTTTRIGTPAYMAPEQLAGGLVAPCIDVWALGVMLFEMVSGRVPFETAGGASPQLVETAPRVEASPAYARLVAACLEREPGRRPKSIAEVARALRANASERFTEDLGAAPPPPTIEPAPARRHRWIAPVAAIALGIGAAVAWRMFERPAAAPPAPVAHPVVAVPVAPPVEPAPVAPPPATELAPASEPTAAPVRRHHKPHAEHRGSAQSARAGETLD